jgi:hypothetical protein
LAASKGMGFTIDQEAVEQMETRAKEPRTNYRLQSILEANDLTFSQYQEIAERKKMGKTSTDENFQAEGSSGNATWCKKSQTPTSC